MWRCNDVSAIYLATTFETVLLSLLVVLIVLAMHY